MAIGCWRENAESSYPIATGTAKDREECAEKCKENEKCVLAGFTSTTKSGSDGYSCDLYGELEHVQQSMGNALFYKTCPKGQFISMVSSYHTVWSHSTVEFSYQNMLFICGSTRSLSPAYKGGALRLHRYIFTTHFLRRFDTFYSRV